MPEEEKKPVQKKIPVLKVKCTCIRARGLRSPDPGCRVTLHNDQVDSIFDELGVTSDILDK